MSAPICDVCGRQADSISSAGGPGSRRFACADHRGSRPVVGAKWNEPFRTTMSYDDALAIMRAAAPKRRATQRRGEGSR